MLGKSCIEWMMMCRWSIPSASPRLCVKLLNTDSSPGEWPRFSYYFSCFSTQIKLYQAISSYIKLYQAWPACRSSSFLDKDHTASWTWCPSQHPLSDRMWQVTVHCCTAVLTEVIVATMLLESLRLLFALTSAAFRSFWKGEDMRSDDPMNLRWSWWRLSELEQKLQPIPAPCQGTTFQHFLRTFSVSASRRTESNCVKLYWTLYIYII